MIGAPPTLELPNQINIQNMHSYVCKIDDFCTLASLFSSVLSAAKSAGGPPVHTAQLWTLVEVRGACSGGSRSRKLLLIHTTWQLLQRALFVEAEPARPMQTPQLIYLEGWTNLVRVFSSAAVSRCPSSSQDYYIAAGTVQQQSRIKLFPCDWDEPCLCVCV